MADPIVGNAVWVAGAFGAGVTITAVSPTGTVTTSGTPTDPSGAITFAVTDPTGAVVTTTIDKDGSGVYSQAVYCPLAGTWECVITAAYGAPGYGASKVTWTVAPA